MLKTAEFMPLIVFIEAPSLKLLTELNRKEEDSGNTGKVKSVGV